MHFLPFIKMHGTGNDFVVLDELDSPLPAAFDFSAAAIAMCDRHRGIGADGLLLLTRPSSPDLADVRKRMWNPDGTEDMCGNGLRCIALLAWRHQHVATREFKIETLAGIRSAMVLKDEQVTVTMGEPSFRLADIPLLASEKYIQPLPSEGEASAEYSLLVGDEWLPHVTTLSTGTTHMVVFLTEPPDEETFQRLSPQIEHHPCFPERTSVLWAVVRHEQAIELRIWERGVGETLACGTGACAAAVAAQVTGRCSGTIDVRSRGGTLRIDWRPGQEIQMTGPAVLVYGGFWRAGFQPACGQDGRTP